jgi:hypothetical protein
VAGFAVFSGLQMLLTMYYLHGRLPAPPETRQPV